MAPVHAHERYRTVAHHVGNIAEGLAEEPGELRTTHFPACERELAVPDRAQAANIAVDLHVVRRIGEDEVGLGAIHQRLEVDRAARIAAQQAMAAKVPQVARTRHGRASSKSDSVLGLVRAVRICLARLLYGEVDLGQAEPGQLDVELEVDHRLKLDGEEFLVPAGIERELVIGEHIRAPLGFGEVRERDGGHRLPLE